MLFWKPSEKNAFTEIKRLSESLSNHSSHSAIQKLLTIFNNLFQSFNQSLFSNLYEEAFKQNSNQWTKTFAYAVELFNPKSEIGKTIIANKDTKVQLDNLHFSSEYQSYLKQSELSTIQILKKQDYAYRLPLLQCFFINLALCITAQKDQERKINWEDAFYDDEFYYYIVKNPILVIIKNWLAYTRTNSPFYSRIIKVLEIVLLRDMTTQIRKKQRVSIKHSVIYAIYVISQWKVGLYHWEFLESISEILEKRITNPNLLTLWIRLSLSIILNATRFQEKARQELRQYNSIYNGQARKYFENLQQFSSYNFTQTEPRTFLSFLYKVESLIQKNFWDCTPLFMQSIFIIISLAKKLINYDQCSFRLNFLKSVFRRAHIGLKSVKGLEIVEKLKAEYQAITFSNRPEEEEDDDQTSDFNGSNNERRNYSKNGKDNDQKRHRKSLLAHQELSSLNPWMKPLAGNQSILLFEMSKWLATKVDKIQKKQPFTRGKHKDLPNTDLRFLASYKIFGLCLLIMLGLILLLKHLF